MPTTEAPEPAAAQQTLSGVLVALRRNYRLSPHVCMSPSTSVSVACCKLTKVDPEHFEEAVRHFAGTITRIEPWGGQDMYGEYLWGLRIEGLLPTPIEIWMTFTPAFSGGDLIVKRVA